jgi:hypothetical protein
VNGGSRRGGEKPRGRSTIDGVATVDRRRDSFLREWTFTGPSGDGPSARDEVPGEAGSAHREVSRSGSARRERRRRGQDGRRRDGIPKISARAQGIETVKLPSVTTNSKTETSERPTTDGCTGGGGRPRDLEHQPTPRVARSARGGDRALRTPL